MDIQAEPANGVVPAGETIRVAVLLCPKLAGDMTAPIFFNVAGSPLAPLRVLLKATGQGAVLAVHPDVLDWGRLKVLTDAPRTVVISNVSLIPATFSCTTVESPSVFRCSPNSGELAPGQSCEITIHTHLDDTLKFSDELVFTAAGGSVQRVPLSAVGVGSTIVGAEPLDLIDFGNVFSNRECERIITIFNRGRRPQKLQFVLDSPPPGASGHCTIMRGGSFKKTRTPACPNPPDPSISIFGIAPEKLALNPGESATIAVRGLGSKPEVCIAIYLFKYMCVHI